MKKASFLLFLITLVACSPKNEFEINGEVEGIKEGTAYLKLYTNKSLTEIDTAKIVDGEFEFEGTTTEPQLYLIFIEGKQAPISFFLDNSKVRIKANADSLHKSKITGLKVNKPYDAYQKNMPLEAEANLLKENFLKAQQANDINKMNQLRDEYTPIVEQQKKYFEKFIWDNTNNVVGAYFAQIYAPSIELDKLKELVAKLKSGAAANSKYVLAIEESLKAIEASKLAVELTKEGKTAPDFTFINLKGESVSLQSLRGKVVLIDFWASWCRPCRAENPNVVAVYKKYNKNNFEIVSISLDKDEVAWKEAIKADGLNWNSHHWDKEGVIANQYGVQSIPHTLLLGKDGTILYKDLRGGELELKLKPLL